MRISAKGFIYHKSAENFVDCFDRYNYNIKNNKFAIADGVSKSFFPDVWAELLVNFFVESAGRINLTDNESYKKIQNAWIKKIAGIVNKPNQKYYVKNFFIEGRSAAATFVGLHFLHEDGALKWEAVALGDSYLFFVPKHEDLILSNFENVIHLSSKNTFEFNNFPDYFDSRSVNNKGKMKQKKHEVKNGTFYLMTDALAEWFVKEKEVAIKIIDNWKTQEDFVRDINEYRKTNMNNDDATILVINVTEDYISEIAYDTINITDYEKLLDKEKDRINKNGLFTETLPTIDEQIISKFDQIEAPKNNYIFSEAMDSLNKRDEKKKGKKEKEEKEENENKIKEKEKALNIYDKNDDDLVIKQEETRKSKNIWQYLFNSFFGR